MLRVFSITLYSQEAVVMILHSSMMQTLPTFVEFAIEGVNVEDKSPIYG